MTQTTYEPLKLSQTNRYAGYQFHARIRIDGMEPIDAFRYLVLSVYKWVRQRVPEEDRKVPELQLPEAVNWAEADPAAFRPYHFSIGYTLDITPLMDEWIWALRLKEPDNGTKEREAVPGRFFTTRIGLRMSEKGYTELGIRIDITDPAAVGKELDFAFRPGFVRTLAIQPAVSFEQVRELRHGQADWIQTEEDYKRLLYMLDHEDNQLPLVVFTYARPGEKKPGISMSMEELVKSDPLKSFLQFSERPIPGIGWDFLSAMENPVEYGKKMAEAAEPPEMTYDADAFSRSAFAYGRTYVLGDRFTEKFRSRIRNDFRPGDILICGAKKFRGGVTVVSYAGKQEEQLKKAYDSALLTVQSCSKHKAAYTYGNVLFEGEARKWAQQKELQYILASEQLEEKERYAQLVRHTEELNRVIDSKDEKIARLEKQRDEEFDRGVAFRDNEYLALQEENARLKREAAEKQDQIDQMLGKYQQAQEITNIVDQIRGMDVLPQSNEDVVRYFRMAYRDRIDFTERGAASAGKCSIKAERLWTTLFTVANPLVDVFRVKESNLTEDEIMKATGFEMSFREGSMTREQKEYMRLREDRYCGETISVEPHLKLKAGKGEAAHQRLHFWYDPERKRIVIGYVGDHLDSAATRYAGQR